jgi:hypothetical protein
MHQTLIVFIAQFFLIMLLGLQSINVNRGQKLLAAITSLLLGVSGFFVTGIVAQVYQQFQSQGVTITLIAFLAAGPLGIITSIFIHPYLRRIGGST